VDLLQTIVESEAVSPLLMKMLFGESESEREDTFDLTCDYPKVLHNVLLFYQSVIQVYLIAQAKDSMSTLRELLNADNAYSAITGVWTGEDSYELKYNEKTLYSLLIAFTEIDNSHLFTKDALSTIKKVRDAYQRFNTNTRVRELISSQDFLLTLQSLPLLQYTSIDRDSDKITIAVPGGKEIISDCRPFIFFIDPHSRMISNSSASRPYIMTSAMNGERNGELRFTAVELNSINITPRSIVLTIPVASNENLLIACKVLQLPTQWYPVGEFMGDYLFLKKLTDVVEEVIIGCIESKHGKKYNDKQNVLPEIRKLFKNTALYDNLSSVDKIEKVNIDKLFFELFIEFGVFKTIMCLLLDSELHNQEDMFLAFLDAFTNGNQITPEQRNNYVIETNKAIDAHMNKLKTIVVERTASYKQRCKEIRAEWRTFYILKAAGIKNEKLVADLENILSIDDYFDMIRNPYSTLKDDLKDVLTFLIAFYSPLIEDVGKSSKEDYAMSVRKCREELASKASSIPALFDRFIQIVKSSSNNTHIEELLGRKILCDVNELENYKRKFMSDDALIAQKNHELMSKKSIFISYSHQDSKRVLQIANMLKERHFNIFIDETKFKGGDAWRDRAMAAIEDEDCIGVIAFMSETVAESEPVKYELKFARDVAKKKYPENPDAQDRFIVPVNLSGVAISTYLTDASYLRNNAPKREIALKLSDIIPGEIIYYPADDPNNDVSLIEDLSSHFAVVVKENEAEGYLIDNDDFQEVALDIANFYTFLKTSKCEWHEGQDVVQAFKNADLSHCVYPIVVSVKETRIKRDNVTLLGYEIVKGKGRGDTSDNYILSSKKLTTEDYYCVPNYRRVGEDCSWMIEPLLVSHECFKEN
jgi:hypothetical protein